MPICYTATFQTLMASKTLIFSGWKLVFYCCSELLHAILFPSKSRARQDTHFVGLGFVNPNCERFQAVDYMYWAWKCGLLEQVYKDAGYRFEDSLVPLPGALEVRYRWLVEHLVLLDACVITWGWDPMLLSRCWWTKCANRKLFVHSCFHMHWQGVVEYKTGSWQPANDT